MFCRHVHRNKNNRMDGAKQQVQQEYQAEAAAVAAAQGIPDHLDPTKVDTAPQVSPKKVLLFFNSDRTVLYSFSIFYRSNSFSNSKFDYHIGGRKCRMGDVDKFRHGGGIGGSREGSGAYGPGTLVHFLFTSGKFHI